MDALELGPNVITLDVVRGKFRKEKTFCNHHQYQIDEEAGLVYCTRCEMQISPFQALLELARSESRFKWRLQELRDQEKKMEFKFANKKRTKCRNCGKFTPVGLK